MRFLLGDYRKLILVPILLLLFSIGVIASHYARTGSVFEEGIDFSGGTHATVPVSGPVDIKVIEQSARQILGSEAIVRFQQGKETSSIVIETKEQVTSETVGNICEMSGIPYNADDVTIRSVGAAMSESFLKGAWMALAFAFLMMAAVVFLTFRIFVPSVAIIMSAVSDILFAVAMMDIVGVEFSFATLAALLMLLGYSVDTDILLCTRLLKRTEEGSLEERIISSMKTGVTMTGTGIISFIVLYLVSTSRALDQMALVIIFGLLADFITTWFQNVSLLRWHLERKKGERIE